MFTAIAAPPAAITTTTQRGRKTAGQCPVA
jgi:hypothetical protein